MINIPVEINGKSSNLELSNYGSDQPLPIGTVKVNNGELELTGSLWQKVKVDYKITEKTILEFEFQPIKEGERHTIGFDENNVVYESKEGSSQKTDDTTFQIWGTQGKDGFDPITGVAPDKVDSNWYKYKILLSEWFNRINKNYLNKRFNYLTFGNDQDGVQNPNASSKFRNIRIYESELEIANEDAIQEEGNGGIKAFTFNITRNGDTSSFSSVNWKVIGSGTNPADDADFAGGTLPSGTVSFAPGETNKTITVNVLGDIKSEPDEEFTVTLFEPINTSIRTASATATIENDDTPDEDIPDPEPDEDQLFDRIFNRTDIYAIKLHQDNIYIAGSTRENLDNNINNGEENAFVSMYSIDGKRAWTRPFPSLEGNESATSITINNDNLIFVSFNFNDDIAVFKFNSNGDFHYSQITGTNKKDFASAVTSYNDSIYTAGFTEGNLHEQSNSGGFDAFVIKYDSNLKIQWTRVVGSTNDDFANAITTGLDGSIYVAGYTTGSLDNNINNGGRDGFITKYTSEGVKLWTRLLGTNRNDSINSITVGKDGFIYVAGYTEGNLDNNTNNFGGLNGFITKYTTNGIKLWTKLIEIIYDGSINTITTGLDGSIYVAGYTDRNFFGKDAFVQKYDTSGVKAWEKVIADNFLEAKSIAIKPEDNSVLIAGIIKDNQNQQSNSSAIKKIVDSNTTIDISPITLSSIEGNSGLTPFYFAITRRGNIEVESSVNWTFYKSDDFEDVLENGTVENGTVEFKIGEREKKITINVQGDTSIERNERFTVWLTSVENATITNGNASSIIISDDTEIRKIEIAKNYAYTLSNDGFLITNISNPNQPQIVGGFDTFLTKNKTIQDIAAVDNYVFIITLDSIEIIDVSKPSTPEILSVSSFSGSYYNSFDAYYNIEVSDKYAYISTLSALKIIHIENPFNPKYIKDFKIPNITVWDIHVSGKYGYVVSRNSGIQVIDLTDPTTPKLISTYDTGGDCVNAEIIGNYLYIANSIAGIQIVDISNPLALKRISNYDTDGDARTVKIVEKYAYVADGTAGLAIIDISNPSAPTLFKKFNFNTDVQDLQIVGDQVYIATNLGLKVINKNNRHLRK
jgi:hypothetical protein